MESPLDLEFLVNVTKGGLKQQGCFYVQKAGSAYRFLYKFKAKGLYEVEVFAREVKLAEVSYSGVFKFEIQNESNNKLCFP